MALTPTIRISEASTLAATNGTDLRTSEVGVMVAVNFPTQFITASEGTVNVSANHSPDVQVSEASTLVMGRGRVQNPRLRAWTYTQDGHDFYVLRLGDDYTFVYDLTTEQWMRFTSQEYAFWRPNTGMNWIDGMRLAVDYGSNVIVGDDTFGLLWFLDPNQGYDDDTDREVLSPKKFPRVATGQMIAKARQYVSCFQVYLTASGGFPSAPDMSVELKYSDDAGNNYVSAGLQPVTAGDYTQNLDWLSLGRYSYPGRLYQIIDDGALARIDSLDILDG